MIHEIKKSHEGIKPTHITNYGGIGYLDLSYTMSRLDDSMSSKKSMVQSVGVYSEVRSPLCGCQGRCNNLQLPMLILRRRTSSKWSVPRWRNCCSSCSSYFLFSTMNSGSNSGTGGGGLGHKECRQAEGTCHNSISDVLTPGGRDLRASQSLSALRKSCTLLSRPVQQFACMVTTLDMFLLFCNNNHEDKIKKNKRN